MTLTQESKKQLRSRIFRHLDGIVTVPTAFTLYQAGVLQQLSDKNPNSLTSLTEAFKANQGYLNVALRVLCSQGWLSQQIEAGTDKRQFAMTTKGEIAMPLVKLFKEAVDFIPEATKMEDYIVNGFPPVAFMQLRNLFDKYKNKLDIEFSDDTDVKAVQEEVFNLAEGAILGPLVVGLGISGLFNKYFTVAPFEVEEFSGHHMEFKEIVSFFKYLGWFSENNNVFNFTQEGIFFAKRAGAYGVTVSYLPTFQYLTELIFGNPAILWNVPANSPEIHVNRRMNVWGSGSAHSGYFKKIDEVILDLFNRPIHQQPKGFIDMGCGDGTLLAHIFEVIWTRTQRGNMLDDHPLFIIGADYNEAALAATRNTLNQADIWAKVVWGDIGDPQSLATTVKQKYDINLEDLLHVRSFLDHNRIYKSPEKVNKDRNSDSTGAFAFRGAQLSPNEVEENLLHHFSNWMPYVKKFGLLVIELHTLPPQLVAENLGKTPATAYDATHGFSDQYILELPCFLKAANEAGLHPDPFHQAKFPNSDLATVSINVLKSKEYF